MKEKKKLLFASVVASLIMCVAMIGGVYAEDFETRLEFQENEKLIAIETHKQDVGSTIILALVGIVIAVNVIPIIANQTAALEVNADLDSNEQDLVGIWPLLVIIGVMVGIVTMMI